MTTGANQIRTFVEAVFLAKPPEPYTLVWTLHNKRSEWFQDIENMIRYVESQRARDTYVGVALSPSDFGPVHRCSSRQTAGLIGFGADFDIRSEAHKKPLPTSIDQALSIIPPQFPPTIVVSTGNGVHAWWLLNRAWMFNDDNDRREGATLSWRLNKLLEINSRQHGWTFDLLADLARVLRVPGTMNVKDSRAPKEVAIHSFGERRYEPEEIKAFLDHLRVPVSATDQTWVPRSVSQPSALSFEIDFDAAIPEEQLSNWMSTDSRFQRTWNRQRDDLTDASPSGYDMALADFGVDHGLCDQQIVNLIVHNRRQHGDKRRHGRQYYDRTVSKAKHMLRRRTVCALPSDAGVSEPSQPDPPSISDGSLDEMHDDSMQKVRLCDCISERLGIRILRIVKVEGNEPMFFLETDGARIEFPTVKNFISQADMRLALAGQVGKMMPVLNKHEWTDVAQMLLNACVVQETDELTSKGSARTHIAAYLTSNSVISPFEHVSEYDAQKPIVDDGRIAISSMDLRLFINKTTMQNLNLKAIISMLTAIGARHVRIRGVGIKEQSRWALPVSEFDPRDYSGPEGVD